MPGHADLASESVPFTVSFGVNLLEFLRPKDPEAILNTITSEQFGKDEFLPYWAEHWPSAEGMLDFLYKSPLRDDGAVCEMGCGLGIISAALAPRSGLTVAADYAFDACRYARHNCSLAARGRSPDVLCSDWRGAPFRRAFDAILGSDILYERRWVEPVIAFIEEVLKPDGAAYVADPKRSHWRLFLDSADEAGFVVDIVHSVVVNEGKSTVEVARLAKKGR